MRVDGKNWVMKATSAPALVLTLLASAAGAETAGKTDTAATIAAPLTENTSVGASAPPACDAACIRGNADRAVQACAPRIEAEAPGDFEWLMRPYGSIFQQADAPEQSTSSVVRYRGDSIRFLSPQKEWIRAIYECGYDTARQQITSVRVKLGVLGKANAVPVLPAPLPQARIPQAAPAHTASAQVQTAKPPQPAAPTSDRRRVGELDEVSVLQVKPSAKLR